MTERIISHHSLPVSAPQSFWSALGWQTYTNSDTAGPRSYSPYIDRYIAIALANGLSGEQALAAAVKEEQRVNAEQASSGALRSHAEALTKLANSLRSEADAEVVSRIMSRLTEKTQYAIRQQLAGTGLIAR